MKKRKYSFGVLVAVIYGLLSLALLISFTAAKYVDGRRLFTDFRAAQFNVAILMGDGTQAVYQVNETTNATEGGNTDATEGDAGDDAGDGGQDSPQFSYQLNLRNLRPGMVGETAVRVPFSVSNGPNANSTAKVGVKYTIQVLTGGNLPLQFSLEEVQQDAQGNVTQTVVYQAGEPERQEPETGTQDHVWYQYPFLPNAQESRTGGTGSDALQMEFLLVPERIGTYMQNRHTLVVEWPAGEGNDLKYMKEVEPIHILVTAHSINRLENEDYALAQLPDTPAGDFYTPGVVLLADGVESSTYTLDLRAFQRDTESDSRTFDFWVDNGIGQNKTQTKDKITYSIGMKLPLEKTGDPAAWQNLRLSFQMDGEALSQPSHYLVYDEKTGLPRTNEDTTIQQFTLEQIQALELLPHERPYAIYTGISGTLLNYAIDDNNQRVWAAKRNSHTLTLSGADVDRITDLPLADSFSFHNKVELLITAEFQNTASNSGNPEQTVPGETESGETEPKETGSGATESPQDP